MKNILIGTGAVALLLIGGSWWSKSLQKSDPDVISQNGIHWHAQLKLFVKGEEQGIPPGIGLGGAEMGMHTHEPDGTIHMEYSGLVKKEDITLGRFFGNWGKDMRSFGSSTRMTVNGKESADYENYMMKDGDSIELRYE